MGPTLAEAHTIKIKVREKTGTPPSYQSFQRVGRNTSGPDLICVYNSINCGVAIFFAGGVVYGVRKKRNIDLVE